MANARTRLFVACATAFSVFAQPGFSQDPPQQAAVVSALTAARGEAPLPIVGRGAPNYSPEQTASFLCEQLGADAVRAPRVSAPPAALRGARRGAIAPPRQTDADREAIALDRRRQALQRAHDMTLAARTVRIRAFTGQATAIQMERAELDRQAAVSILGASPRADPAAARTSLTISGIKRERVLENGRAVLLVTGQVRNPTGARVVIPPFTVQALDVRGFVLAGQTEAAARESLAPGETLDFTFRFKNPPQYTAEIHAVFAPPFGVRNFRGCEFLDPLEFDARAARLRAQRVRPVPVPEAGDGAPRYAADEIAALAREARTVAQASFARSAPACAPLRPWRPWLITADLMEEAWIATTAAEEARRDAARALFTPEEVAQAELARQAAVRDFMQARPEARTVTSGEHPGLTVERVTLSEARGGDLRVRGQVKNDGKAPAAMPNLMITVTDPHGFIVFERLLRGEGQVPAGRTTAFELTEGVPRSLGGTAKVVFAC